MPRTKVYTRANGDIHWVSNTSKTGKTRSTCFCVFFGVFLKNVTQRQNWTELKCQSSCVARTVQSEQTGNSVQFISVHFAMCTKRLQFSWVHFILFMSLRTGLNS